MPPSHNKNVLSNLKSFTESWTEFVAVACLFFWVPVWLWREYLLMYAALICVFHLWVVTTRAEKIVVVSHSRAIISPLVKREALKLGHYLFLYVSCNSK